MAALHFVRNNMDSPGMLLRHLARMGTNDLLLLGENGVYNALEGSASAPCLIKPARRGIVFALEPDLTARGLLSEDLIGGITLVDYAGFVALTVRTQVVVTW